MKRSSVLGLFEVSLGTMPTSPPDDSGFLDAAAFRAATAFQNDAAGVPLSRRYRQDNAWCSWWKKDFKDDVANAYALYERAATNDLGCIVLGETEIRKDRDLIQSFGLASAGGIQDKPEEELVATLQRERLEKHGTTQAILGMGSILSDKNWTPLLNDALILGGIHTFQDFLLADDQVFRLARLMRRPPPQDMDEWRAFFKFRLDLLYASFGPRVLAREFIGLATFGYQPVFQPNQLGFVCADRDAARSANFVTYCDVLKLLAFDAMDDEEKAFVKPIILGALGRFLFQDENFFMDCDRFFTAPRLKRQNAGRDFEPIKNPSLMRRLFGNWF